jgi:hypothetical protein
MPPSVAHPNTRGSPGHDAVDRTAANVATPFRSAAKLTEVQDRYAGDVGDFVTYGLLRVLCASRVGRLGVVWYRVADETHNADGRHVTYLDAGNRIGRRLRECDSDLFDAMRAIVSSGSRSVAAVESSGVLPARTRFHSAPVPTGSLRAAWFRAALRTTEDCDVVFLDPDNGVAFGPRAVPVKYATVDELAAFAARGQSVVVYQHADRSAAVEQQARRLLRRIGDTVPGDPLAAVLARRGSVRMFVLIPRESHRRAFVTALEHITAVPWGSELQPVYPDAAMWAQWRAHRR